VTSGATKTALSMASGLTARARGSPRARCAPAVAALTPSPPSPAAGAAAARAASAASCDATGGGGTRTSGATASERAARTRDAVGSTTARLMLQ
jgi:hypothetical protein